LESTGDVTILLQKWGDGDLSVSEPLFELIYPQLKRIAGSFFGSRQPTSMQPTSLVNELYLKLLKQRRLQFDDRAHFFSLAARMMRRVLVDQARHDTRQKRSGTSVTPLHDDLAWIAPSGPEMLDLNLLLDELEQMDARRSRTAELRFFLGFTSTETADLLKSSRATVDRDLKFVRVWLYDRMHPSKS